MGATRGGRCGRRRCGERDCEPISSAKGRACHDVEPAELAKIVAARNDIPRKTFDDALAHVGDDGFSAEPYLAQKAVADTSELEPIVDRVLADNPDNVAAYRGGKEGLLGFFVGQVMKATNGQADARVVNELLRSKLGS